MKKTKMMKKNYEFRNVLSRGKYYSGKRIEAFIKKNNKETINFLGIAIGVKIAKAVKRNHIKRLIREKNVQANQYKTKVQQKRVCFVLSISSWSRPPLKCGSYKQ